MVLCLQSIHYMRGKGTQSIGGRNRTVPFLDKYDLALYFPIKILILFPSNILSLK